MASRDDGFKGNKFLKRVGEVVEFTPEQVKEYARCSVDPVYFIETYCKIVSLDDGIVDFKLFPYQKRIIKALHTNRKVIGKIGRQLGKSSVCAGYLAWFVLFNERKNTCVLANKMRTAMEIFSRIQFTIEYLPKWLQQGVKEWNKTKFVLENGSKCFCAPTSPSAIRGESLNAVMLDEFAFLSPNLAEAFMASVFPTLSSSENSKIIIVSTPKGMNHYYKIWTDAVNNLNGFVTVDAHWSEHPKRTQKWADAQLAELGELKFNQEVRCDFLGSSASLIEGYKISSLAAAIGKIKFDSFIEYEPVRRDKDGKPSGSYIITTDVARGSELDYSAFVVFDITQLPYKIVAKYRNNKVDPQLYPEIIYRVAKAYNEAFVLVETNDIGQQVADILFYDLEYENVYMSLREKINEGQGKKIPGLRTTKKTKALGCSQVKTLVENDSLIVNDMDIISEMSTFVRVANSYKAEEGKTDDLMMCLVMFGYLTLQPVFKELFDYNLRGEYLKRQIQEMNDFMEPIGFLDRGPVIEKAETTVRPYIEGDLKEWNPFL